MGSTVQHVSIVPLLLASLCVGLLATEALASGVFTIEPAQDTFVRASEPSLNYGVAGALAVAGPDAVNATGQSQGRYETLLQFDVTDMVDSFDTAYGQGGWEISSALLRVVEVGAPNNPIFNRGAGQFEIRWFSSDDWVEGPGKPNAPTVGQANEMTYALLQTMLGSTGESSLGVFVNEGADGTRDYVLSLAPAILDDLASGGPVSLHMVPVTSTIGFTFNSRNNTTPAVRTELVVTAVPEPTAVLSAVLGTVMWRRRRTV